MKTHTIRLNKDLIVDLKLLYGLNAIEEMKLLGVEMCKHDGYDNFVFELGSFSKSKWISEKILDDNEVEKLSKEIDEIKSDKQAVKKLFDSINIKEVLQ